MLLLVSGVLLPIVLLFLLWDQGVVDLPLLKSNKVRREHQRFATVGPVMTSIGQNQHIKMTVRIECKNTRLKEKVAEIESAVKSKLLFVLSSPEVKEKLRLQDYAAIKAFFKKEVDSLLPNDTVEAVYFSEIIRY
jgi:flagellar basal body-associated protein FliL